MKNVFKKFSDYGLQKKLIISYFPLIFIPIVVVGMFTYFTAATSIKSEVSSYISEVLKQVNVNLDNSLSEMDRIISGIGSDHEVQEILMQDKELSLKSIITDDEVMNSKIGSVTILKKNIEGFFIFSYNGMVYQYRGANNSILPDYNFTRTRWFITMKSLAQKKLLLPTHIQDEVIGEGQPKKVFSMVKEVNDLDSGKPIGSILIDMNTEVFESIIDKLNVRKYQELIIIDNNKTILYHTSQEKITTQFRTDYISKLLKLKNGNMIVNTNSGPILVTFNTSSVTNWTVISIIPVKYLYSKITYLKYIINFTVLFCMILAFFFTVLLSNNITKPIFKLRSMMEKVESGEFETFIPVKTKDEVGELSLTFNHMIQKIKELIQRVYKTEILRTEAELNALQAQINPHFLYNTLQTMDVIAEAQGVDVISTMCQALSKIFRYSISQGREIVPLASEIEHVRNYIYIQKIRFKSKFEIVYDLKPEFLNYQIIKLILQPLVENALYHGVQNKFGESMITISSEKVGEILYLKVKDTGVGMDESQLEQLKESLNDEILHADTKGFHGRSIGIKNVHARIKLYFGKEFGINITSRLDEGTEVTVILPAIPYA